MAAFVYLLTIVAIGSIQVEASAVRATVNKHLTYNTALFDFSLLPGVIPVNREERRDGIIQALNGSDADLVCLEEVWIGQDVEAIVDGVSSFYPYSYSILHDANGTLPDQANAVNEPACNTTLLTDYLNCTAACASLPVGQQAACSATNCAAEFNAILEGPNGPQCSTCLYVKILRPASEIIASCTAGAPAVGLRTLNPLGLVVLSKKPLTNRSVTQYYTEPLFIGKGYLEFTFDSYLKGACTYLSTIENPGAREPFLVTRFATLEEQNLFEVTALATAFKRERPFVLLGAINVGLAFTPDVIAVAPENYRELRCAFEQTLPADNCTLCSGTENPYNVGDGSAPSTIDHVLGNGLFFRDGEIVFTLASNSVDINGTAYPLSDHYGYQVTSYYRPVSHH